MSRYEWLVSAFVSWHLLSFGLAAIASPDEIGRYQDDSVPVPYQISAWLRPAADTAATALDPLARSLWHATAPARFVTAPYAEAVALRQQWVMFVRPNKNLAYVRMRYYWRSDEGQADGALLVADELVAPRDREDHTRLAASFLNSFHSKAISSSLSGFYDDSREGLSEYSPYLTPLLSYFTQRFEATYLRQGGRVLRAELWHGVTPLPPPGHRVNDDMATAHLDAVRSYYGAVLPRQASSVSSSTRESIEQEADVVWTLLDLSQSP